MTLVQQKWCLGECVLPLKAETLELLRLDGDKKQCMEEHAEFLMLPLTTTANIEWLVKYLGKTKRWWQIEGTHLPLITEIRLTTKQEHPNLGVFVQTIEVRANEILVYSNTAKLSLAFKKDQFQNLEWFLDELKKDLRHAADHPDEAPSKKDRKT